MTWRVMARSPSRPHRVAATLQQVVQRFDPERRLDIYRVWNAVVGTAIAARAQPQSVRDGVLAVRVQGAAWMQELQFAKEDIRQRLNAALGAERIRDVYFVSGRVAPVEPPARVAPPRAPMEAIPLPPLSDPRLAAQMARIVRAHQQRGRRGPP
ncbi:MAG: DUF721 domain-containing protein [Candidatus Binatia bacterium]